MSLHEPDEETQYPLILDFFWPDYPDRMPSGPQTPDNLESREQTPVIIEVGPAADVLSYRAEENQTMIKEEEIAIVPNSRSDQQSTCARRDPHPSHDASSHKSDPALYVHQLLPGSILGRSVPENRQFSSRPPTPLVERSRSISLAPSLASTILTAFTGTPVVIQVEKEISGRSKRKRNAVGRKSEQRRTQNMFAQKKYRDKRLHAAELMSESLVQIQVALDRLVRESPEGCLDRIQCFMNEYRLDMEALDPILLAKQDKEVQSQNF